VTKQRGQTSWEVWPLLRSFLRHTVSVKSDTKTEVESGRDLEVKSKTEGTTGTGGIPFLGVKSLTMLSSSCS
jgi:hypothetical protein